MDDSTANSLNFKYIIDKIKVKTPYGQIYKNKMKAFTVGQEEELKEELNRVERFIAYFKDDKFIANLSHIFHEIKDLRNSIKRAREGLILTEVELFEIKKFLFLIRELKKLLDEKKIALGFDIEPIDRLESLLDPESTGISTFYIYDCYSEELKRIRTEIKDIEREIKKERKLLRERIHQDIAIRLSPDGTVTVPKDNIELMEKLRDYPHLSYVSENYMAVKYSTKPTDNISFLEKRIQILKGKEDEEELIIRERLSKEIGKHTKKLWRNIAAIGKLDFTLSKAHLAFDMNLVKPNIVREHSLIIKDGRHPQIEELLNKKGLKFTPISVELKDGVTCITGANMGGKTVSIKLIGLLTAMAQHGLFVPAKEMTLGLNNFIKSSIGDSQSIDKGLSSFGGEIRLIQEAIELSDDRGLILIDELARGTNPEEGYAISKAIVQYLIDKKSITVLTTHYENIGNIDHITHLQVVGLSNIDFKELESKIQSLDFDKVDMINSLMDYRLVEVGKDKKVPKDAINIARIMGLDPEIIALAEKNLDN